MSAAIEQRNQDATCYVGNLDERVHEELLWELMLQAGPVVNVHMPKDKVTCKYMGYGFVEYRSEEDADYAMKVLNMIKVYGKPIKVNKASQDKKVFEVGANIFIGNLDPDVDEKLLHDTFSAFGSITQTPKILYDPETGLSKGYGFVSFDSFEASDLAIECMNGQFLSNRAIVVQYAYKKDTPGERHGSQAERILAASQPQRLKPNTLFSTGLENGTTGLGLTAAVQQQQFMFQQQQMLMSMQNPYMSMMGMGMGMPMGYPGLPMQMQAPMPMMPAAPTSLPDYMQAAAKQQQQGQGQPLPVVPPPPAATSSSSSSSAPPVPVPPPLPSATAAMMMMSQMYAMPPMPVPPPPPSQQ